MRAVSHLSPGCRLAEDSLLLAASLFLPLNLDPLWPQCPAGKKMLPRAQWMLSVATTRWHSTIQPLALLRSVIFPHRAIVPAVGAVVLHSSRVSPLLFLFAGRLSPALIFTQHFLLTSISGEGIGYRLQYSWASLVAQLVKNLPTMWETWVRSLGWEDPLEKGKASHSSVLAWRIPWTI